MEISSEAVAILIKLSSASEAHSFVLYQAGDLSLKVRVSTKR